jgi:GH24 family phage-related lysozyme (muramidase)
MDIVGPSVSTSTDPVQVLRDMTAGAMRRMQQRGLAPASAGITTPLPQANSADDLMRIVGRYRAAHAASGGGHDAQDTPVQGTYSERRWDFLSREEGVREVAYDDATGKPVNVMKKGNATIGVGFNLERKDAPHVFERVLGVKQDRFHAIKRGEAGLTTVEIRKLFEFSAAEAEAHVGRNLKGIPMREHQRLALVSLAFNAKELIGPKLRGALESMDPRKAVHEILHNSGATKDQRLRARRYREAHMFVGFASNPQQHGIPSFEEYTRR